MSRTLGIDTGLATFGWGIVDQVARPLAAGLFTTRLVPGLKVAEDLAMRVDLQVTELRRVIALHDPDAIAVEAMSWPRGSTGIAAIALSWGGIVGVANALGIPVLHVSPNVWERQVCEVPGHEHVEAALMAYVLEQNPELHAALVKLGKARKLHPLDGIGIAMCAALRPDTCSQLRTPMVSEARAHQRELRSAARARKRTEGSEGTTTPTHDVPARTQLGLGESDRPIPQPWPGQGDTPRAPPLNRPPKRGG